MPRLELHPLSELRREAAGLLAERFERQRWAEPLLPDVDDLERHVPAEGLVAMVELAACQAEHHVDWRMVNLLSSRFWPRRGFRAQYLRLYRAVP